MPHPKALTARLKKVRFLVCDVDGVLTDGSLFLNSLGHELKQFSVLDGTAFVLARSAGLKTAFLSARNSVVVTYRAQECGVKYVAQGKKHKDKALLELCQQAGVSPQATAYIGDDLVDLPVFAHVGLAIAVPGAVLEVKRAAHWVLRTPGGHGAVREVVEKLLQAQGTWNRALSDYLARDAAKN